MRKKTIVILATILITMLLTACRTEITSEEIDNLKNIAFEIKNSEDYKLPEGYEVSYPDSTKTNKIAISIKASKGSGDNVIAIFDMTKAEPELVSYQQDTLGIIIETVFIVILIITVILAAGAFLIWIVEVENFKGFLLPLLILILFFSHLNNLKRYYFL